MGIVGRRLEVHDDRILRMQAQEAQFIHDRELRRQGYDPKYIGVTEVAPVCCKGCGAPIPWAVLNRDD